MNAAERARARGKALKLYERKWFFPALCSLIAAIVLSVSLIAYFLPLFRLLPAAKIAKREEGELRVHFLSVGQGDCSIVEFPEGDALIIDGGDGSFDNNNLLASYLKALNPASLSLVATHADSDHYGGLSYIIKNFLVDTLYLPAVGSETNDYKALLTAANERGIKESALTRYGGFNRESGVELSCLSPYSLGETDENDSSAVLYLSYEGVRVLFGGDISATRERRVFAEYTIDHTIFNTAERTVDLSGITLLKVSHHGSNNASHREWLDLLSPEYAVVSCGRGNSYSHPASGAIERLAEAGTSIFRTDELSHIVFSVKDKKYTIEYGG